MLKDSLYLLSSLVKSLEHYQVDEGEYLTSKTAIIAAEEKMESIRGERQIREDDVSHRPWIPPAQTTLERDDWFVLLDVIPKGTPYVVPGIAKILLCCFLKNCFFILCLLT